MYYRSRRSVPPRWVFAVLATALLSAGCGSRVSGADIVAAAGGGTVTLSPDSLAQLRPVVPAGRPGGPTRVRGPAAPEPSARRAGAVAVSEGDRPRKPAAGASSVASRTSAPSSSGRAKETAPSARCDRPLAPVALGQVGSFSGVTGPLTAGARTALAAWAKDVNARGGLACHPVVLYAADDAADPARAAAAVQNLVQTKSVQALVGTFSTLTQTGLNRGVERAGIPVVGGDLLDASWNSHPNLFPQGGAVASLIRGSIQQTVGAGRTKLGLLYCVESSVCTNGAKLIERATPELGGELVYSAPVSLTQPDFTAQCQNAENAGAQALGLAVDGSAMGRVARSCAALGYHPQFLGSNLTISLKQSEDPIIRENTMSTANSNAPFMRTDTVGQREYRAALRRYVPGLTPDGPSMAAWAAGKLMEAAIAGLGAEARTNPITTETIFKGLGTIRNETLDGLAPPITFSPGQRAAPPIDCTFFALLTEQGWTAKNSKPVCTAGEARSGSHDSTGATAPTSIVQAASERRRSRAPRAC